MKLKSQSFAPFIITAALLLFVSCNNESEKAKNISADTAKTEQVDAASKPSARPAHWGYSGDEAPAKWVSLSPAYSACGEGKSQSPINLVSGDFGSGGSKLNFEYKSSSLKIAHHQHVDDIIDNGHTIQVTVEEGSTVMINDKTYHLKQFHFHTPSEHTVDGKHSPMEIHLVHQADDESLAVIGVLTCGDDNRKRNDSENQSPHDSLAGV